MSFNAEKKIRVPSTVVVGFQTRSDTFTGKLAYITYKDDKGKLRKEASWTGWCDCTIAPLELDNEPMSGFVINKGVNRVGQDYSVGRSSIRIYHPKGFEFEIDVDNLTFLLMHSDVSKRDIMEKCVLSWQGANLILLPVNCEQYTQARAVEKSIACSVNMGRKNAVPGQVVLNTKQEEFVYIGEYEWWNWQWKNIGGSNAIVQESLGVRPIFYNVQEDVFDTQEIKNLKIKEDLSPILNELVQKWGDSVHYQKVVGIEIEPLDEADDPLCMTSGSLYNFDGIHPIQLKGDRVGVCNYKLHYTQVDYKDGSPLHLGVMQKYKAVNNANDFSLLQTTRYMSDNKIDGSEKKSKESLNSYFNRLYKDYSIGQAVFVMQDGNRLAIRKIALEQLSMHKFKGYTIF